MVWNWELPDWPHFIYDPKSVMSFENKFLQGIGGAFAVLHHLEGDRKRQFIVEILTAEAFSSAKIEGEILQLDSLQSSIRRQLGFSLENKKIPQKEKRIGELMCKVYDTYNEELTHEMLFEWHRLLISEDSAIENIGKYRTQEDPMEIISHVYSNPVVHFVAPPSKRLIDEMDGFIQWFNNSRNDESVILRATLAHVYFESIHPFEDGNGRIGRALVEKALSQGLGHPTLIAVSQTISQRKKLYYEALGKCNRTLDINSWIKFFASIIVDAQKQSMDLINFLIAKSKLMHSLEGQINIRQEKALLKMLDQGLKGFDGGLSAENYIAITKAPRASATRDLKDLVERGVFTKTGEFKYTRYWLNIDFIIKDKNILF